MKKMLAVKHFQQATEFTCGPATLLSFLSYHNKKACSVLSEKKLSLILKTNAAHGTHPKNMISYLRRINNQFSYQKNACLTKVHRNIDKKLPSIVLWYDYDEWHWSNVIGYDKKNIILLDPYLEEGIHHVEKSKFNRFWSKLIIY